MLQVGAVALGLFLLLPAAAAAPAPDKPRLSVQTGHAAEINAIAFSPDGRLLASGGVDQIIKLWDLKSTLELQTLRGHTAAVQALAFSPDGRLLASAGTDGVILLWEVGTGRLMRRVPGHRMTITALAFADAGRMLVSGAMDQTIRIWSVDDGHLLHTLVTDDAPMFPGDTVMAVSPDGRFVASGGEIVKLWDIASGALLRTLRERVAPGAQPDWALAFSPDGKSLAIGSQALSLLDLGSGRERWRVGGDELRGAHSAAFAPDGRTLVCGGFEVTLRDAATGRPIRSLPANVILAQVAISPDGSVLAVAGGGAGGNPIRLLDLAGGQSSGELAGRTSPVTALAVSPDGHSLAVGHDRGIARRDTVKLWDLANGQWEGTRSDVQRVVHHLVFAADGRTLAGDGSVWDAAGTQLQHLQRVTAIDAFAYSADGKFMASGTRDGSIQLWDAARGNSLRTLSRAGGEVGALAFSPDGTLLAGGGYDKTVRLWDVATGAPIHEMAGAPYAISALAFSPDGRLLASAGISQPVRIWDVRSGKLLSTLPTDMYSINIRVGSLAFSPDGHALAAGIVPLLDTTGGIIVWEVAGGRVLHRFTGADSVEALTYSADGRLIFGGGDDAVVHVWDAGSGDPLATLLTLGESDWMVVTPDGLFDGSPAAWNQILWRFSSRLFDVAPVETFFNEYFHPGLLAELCSGARPHAVASLERRDRRQPQLALSVVQAARDADGAITSRRVRIHLDLTSAAGARDTRLFRNGSLVKLWSGDALPASGHATLETEIQITAGENRLSAYTFNRDDIKSADATLTLSGAAALHRPGIARVLAIGIDRYSNDQFDLNSAVADAGDFAAEFRRQQDGLHDYSGVEVTPLYDGAATRAGILAALQRIRGLAQPEDAVVVYYAGHGTARDERFFLIPQDLGYTGDRDALDGASLDRVLARSISDQNLALAFEGIDAGRFLVVIDACNSGQMLEAREKRRGPMNSKGLAQLAYEKGMYVLTASQSYQEALEPADLGHGLLTYVLVEEGLKQGAADRQPKDGRILLREWLDFTVQRVPQMQSDRARQRGTGTTGSPTDRLQRPRVFYRRELEANPMIVSERQAP